jgi:hypothetical protein
MSSAFMSSWLLSASVNAGPPCRLSASCSSLDEMAMLLHTQTQRLSCKTVTSERLTTGPCTAACMFLDASNARTASSHALSCSCCVGAAGTQQP